MRKQTMTHPDIDSRRAPDIVQRILATAPFYAPEWNPAAPEDAGRALSGIFGDMVFEVIHRLNRVPERHLAAFLDLLNLRQIPAQPAETVAAFTLAKDAKANVTIPAATQVVAAKTEERPELTFETAATIVATPAKLTAVYSAIPDPDKGREKLHQHTEALAAGQSFELFHDSVNVQDHALFIGHGDLLRLEHGGRITLTGLPASFAADLTWTYATPAGTGTFTATATGGIELTTPASKPATAESVVNGRAGIWIKAVPKTLANGGTTLFTVKDSLIKTGLRLGAASLAGAAIPPRMALAGDVPLDLSREADNDFTAALLPFGDKPAALATFYLASDEVFSKKGATVTITIATPYAGGLTVDMVQGIGPIYAGRLRDKGIHTVADVLVRTDAEIAMAIAPAGKPAGPSLTRARNIREATAKEYYDKAGSASLPAGRSASFPQPGLSWEYWNGRGWTVLDDVLDTTGRLLFSGAITFTCPPDIAKTKVAGQEAYWIRVRLVTGDYGKEFQVVGNAVQAAGFTPPRLTRLVLAYAHAPAKFQAPEHLVSVNSLAWEDGAALLAAGKAFQPFLPLPDLFPALYLGFDRPLTGGPVSLFFNLVEQDYPRDFRPLVRWEAYDQTAARWQRLTVEDGTADFTRAGLARILFPDDGARSALFGLDRFWVRAVLVKGAFLPAQEAAEVALAAGTIDARFLAGYLQWKELLREKRFAGGTPFSRLTLAERIPKTVSVRTAASRSGCLGAARAMLEVGYLPGVLKKTPPLAKSIVVNAVTVRERATVRDERLGSGTGLPDQAFAFAKKPVFDEAVWVNEQGYLPKSERDALKSASPERVREVTDRQGTVREIWVRWEGREDLLESGPRDRHYALDRSTGELRFGDGERGRVLPAGRNNLKATYASGGGTAGNVDAAAIARMKTAVPLVDKVTNPEAAGGGVAGETLAAVFQRGPSTIRHRYRAVTAQDYENLIRESFPGLARVRCLPAFDDAGRTRTGWVTVVLVPEADDDRPLPSTALRRKVEDFLSQHAANVVTAPRHAVVVKPTYVTVSVTARLVPVSVDLAPAVEDAALAALARFLHPLRGGWSGSGWPFGRLVCFSDLFTLLEGITGVDRVENLAVSVADAFGNTTELAAGASAPVTLPPYVLVSSGEHKVEAR